MSNLTPRLVVRRGPNPDHVYMLSNETTIVGREPINDAMFPDPEVSRRHARIINKNGDFFIDDLNSTNGTFINGRRISEITRLNAGDIIDFGETVRVVFEVQPIYSNDPVYQDPRLQAFKDPAYQDVAASKTIPPYATNRRDDFYSQLEPPKASAAALDAPRPGPFGGATSRWQNWVIGAGCMMVLILMCTCGVLLWYLDSYQPELLYGLLPTN
ncbi:MAG: FHA domain-containing protein [Chloroflexota bacterium]